jgi:hypothetical protein
VSVCARRNVRPTRTILPAAKYYNSLALCGEQQPHFVLIIPDCLSCHCRRGEVSVASSETYLGQGVMARGVIRKIRIWNGAHIMWLSSA